MVVHDQELRQLIPEGANFGYDVIVHIGTLLFLHSRDYLEIQQDMRDRNIYISTSEIGVLAKKFVLYLSMLQQSIRSQLNGLLQFHGGYILHIDGTCDGGSPHLISVLDGITEIVLDNIKLTSENAEDLIPFLQHIRYCYGEPIALVSDMGKGITGAIATVFPDIPAFICHFHFLKSVGKGLMEQDQVIIRSKLRKAKIRYKLKQVKVRLEHHITVSESLLATTLSKGLSGDRCELSCSLEAMPFIAAYMLVVWILDASSTCDGFGFPFDQPYLALYHRIREAFLTIQQLVPVKLRGEWKDNRCYGWVTSCLKDVMGDKALAVAAKRLTEKTKVFALLRQAMRITLPEQKKGLTDTGEVPVHMKTIQKEVNRFCVNLSHQYPHNVEYQKLIGKIHAKGTQLFADPISVESAAGTILIQPQRTNNLLETFFRSLKRSYMKRNGFSAMGRALKTMLQETPLAMNLKNEQYMKLLLKPGQTLAEKFAQIHIEEIRQCYKEKTLDSCDLYPKLKTIIRLADLPSFMISFMKRIAS